MTASRLISSAIFVVAMAGLLGHTRAASGGDADKAVPPAAAASGDVSGPDLFMQYCALCHGNDGRGTGPLTGDDAMKNSAADLTQIAKNNNGTFPFSRVAATIRDGGGVTGHSPSRMLAWGKIFSAESDPVRAKAIIFEVTRYVESLQEK